MSMMDEEARNMLRAGLLQSQLQKLDKDLALHVVFAALSLNSEKLFKTTQLMGWLQAQRYMKAEKEVSDGDKSDFDEASRNILPSTYLDRLNEEPQ